MKQPLIIPLLYERRELYQVFAPYRYMVAGREEEMEEGMIVDGASVPRLLWWFLPPDGLHRAGVLPHDDVYGRKGKMRSGRQVTRKQADVMLYERMVGAGCARWRAMVVYGGVRAFGWYAWWRSTGEPIVLPVRNQAPTIARKPARTPFTRHIYATPILTP